VCSSDLAFYDQGEPTFVNSVLDRVARQVRGSELPS